MENAMIVEYGLCTGCESCVVSCAKEKQLPEDEWGMKVMQVGPNRLNGTWEWDYVPVPSSVCDLCEGRLQDGKVPLCQLHCLAQVIEVLPLEQASARMAELGRRKVMCYLP